MDLFYLSVCIIWCVREDSNLQPLRDQFLRLARIPIPPLTRKLEFKDITNSQKHNVPSQQIVGRGRFKLSVAGEFPRIFQVLTSNELVCPVDNRSIFLLRKG